MLRLLSFVKVEHTLFSLPHIFAGALLAERGFPSLRVSLLVLLAGVGARTAAFGLNRIIDRRLDARNPRTRERELVTGEIGLSAAWAVTLGAAALLVVSAGLLNPLCLALSPVPLLLFLVYPYTKRFTELSHLALGLCLGVAPVGGFLAVTGSFAGALPAGLLFLAVTLWVAGFDVIYATLDAEHDRAEGLFSIPARFGVKRGFYAAALIHVPAFLLFGLVGFAASLSWPFYLCLGVVGGLFLLEHAVAPRNVNLAFFRLNAMVGVVYFAGVWLGVVV